MIISDEINLASELYLSWKKVPSYKSKNKGKKSSSTAYQKGDARDPVSLNFVVDGLSKSWGWQKELQLAALIDGWDEIVGKNIASKTTILSVSEGTITVECSSTSWATELRRIRGEIITKIMAEYPASEIKELKFIVSGVPTWRHGFRTIKGQGPRDTYK